MVKSNKMQKRAEAEAMLVKDEESDEDKDDVPLAMRLNILNGKNKNGNVKTEDEKEEVPKDANKNGAAENLKAETMPLIGSETKKGNDCHHNDNANSEIEDTNDERVEGNDSSEEEKDDKTAEEEENGHITAFQHLKPKASITMTYVMCVLILQFSRSARNADLICMYHDLAITCLYFRCCTTPNNQDGYHTGGGDGPPGRGAGAGNLHNLCNSTPQVIIHTTNGSPVHYQTVVHTGSLDTLVHTGALDTVQLVCSKL